MQSQQKYFLYARKSTDVEDKQVLSIEAQITELRKFAADNQLHITDTIIEKKSAKTPGRPKFGSMLKRIEANEASGIIAWHPDRLARNSVDGGQIVYLLDQTHLQALKFPTFWFENTSQGKFMLSIAFGQSKYYVDNLSENIKRGLRQKVRRGEMPGLAPIGYINDVRTKTVVVDKRRAPTIVEAFELYAKGASRLEDIAIFLASKGIVTSSGKQFPKDQVKRLLTNPFYYGHFRYAGEVHEGKHEAIISKRLFDDVQATLARRGRPQKGATEPQIFCGLLRCGSCELAVTAEHKFKHQKNGNVHEYVYYRCTKKHKDLRCLESALTEKDLASQLSSLLADYAIPKAWASKLLAMLAEDEKKASEASNSFIASASQKVSNLRSKLQRLLDSYLDQIIDQEAYRTKQAELISEKKSLEEQISKLALASNAWIEPMGDWIKFASSLCEVAKSCEPVAMKQAFSQIEGLNLILSNKKARLLPSNFPNSPQKNIWAALRASLISAASRRSCPDLVRERGLEPPRLSAQPPQGCVYTNFTTRAN